MSDLMVHCGARIVTRDALDLVPVPEATSTWFPVSHGEVVTMVHAALAADGFAVRKQQYALTRGADARLFATLDLESPLAPGVGLSVGIRNSTDKSLPFGFCAGSRTFVCDNLAFKSDLVVSRKHTRNGLERYREAIALAVKSLTQFQQVEAGRIEVLSRTDVSDDRASGVILRAFEDGLVSSRALPAVIREWREPTYGDFRPRTAWSLFNAFTTILGPLYRSSPQRYAGLTMGLQGLVGMAAGLTAEPQQALAV